MYEYTVINGITGEERKVSAVNVYILCHYLERLPNFEQWKLTGVKAP